MSEDTIKTVTALIIGVVVLTVLFSNVLAVADQISDAGRYDTVLDLRDGSDRISTNNDLEVVEVQQTLGDGYRPANGTSGRIQHSADGNWTAGTAVRLDAQANLSNTTQRVLQLDQTVVVDYHEGSWRAMYYNDTSLNSYVVTLPAMSPTDWTVVSVTVENDTLTLAANNSTVSQTVTGTNAVSGNLSASPLTGVVDETRVFSSALTTSERESWVARPTYPVVTASHSARVMYDARAGSPQSVPVYYAGTQLDTTEGSTVAGLAAPGVSSSDYTVSGSQVSASSAKLDGQPAVWVTYDAEPATGLLATIESITPSILRLVLIGGLVAAAGFVVALVNGGRF